MKITIDEAARRIGCAPEYLRQQMRSGAWNIGEAVKPKKTGGNWRYYIFEGKLKTFLGEA